MSRRRDFLKAAVLLLSFQVPGQQDELVLRPVTGSLYVVTGAGCNVVLWLTKDGPLVIDTGEKPALAKKILMKIREISDRPIRYLVFTHYHHIIGAEDFPPSAVAVAHANTKVNIPLYRKNLIDMFEKNIRDLEEKIEELKPAEDSEKGKVRDLLDMRKKQLEGIKRQKDVVPQVTFDKSATIRLGGQEAELLYLGPGHTNGDVLVHFPREKALCVGDLLYTNGWVPRLDGDAGASADNWPIIFDRVARMDVTTIIPGHGEPANKSEFLRISGLFRAYLADLKAEVASRIDQGQSLERIKAELKFPNYRDLGMAEILLPWNVEGVYREIMASKNERKQAATAPTPWPKSSLTSIGWSRG